LIMQKISVRLIKTPPPHAGGDVWYTVRIDTNEGIYGLGESMPHFAFWSMEKSYKKLVEDVFERWFKGKNPFRREMLFKEAYNAFCAEHPDMLGTSILSAIEMAMWDICGKSVGLPIYELLGGACRDRLRSYSYISYDVEQENHLNYSTLYADIPAMRARAKEMLAEGFTALKYDPLEYRLAKGMALPKPYHLELEDYRHTFKTMDVLKQVFQDKCEIIIGTHGQLTTASAISYARALEQYAPMWFEEPVPPENMEEMARVRNSTVIPIAAGERMMTLFEATRAMELGAVSILQPDLGTCGGIGQAKKMSAIAEAHYVDISPHLWGGPILLSAAIQLALSIPNFLIQECIGTTQSFYKQITTTFATWENGFLYPSKSPGLGIELDEERIKTYLIE